MFNMKRLDWTILLVAVVATAVQIAALVIPDLMPSLRLAVLVVLAICLLYAVVRLIAGLSGALFSDAAEAYRVSARRYGLGYRKLRVQCTILANGSAVVRREVEVEAFSEIQELDAYLVIPELTDEVTETPEIDPISLESLSLDRELSLAKFFSKGGALSSLIAVRPPLAEGQVLEYVLEERIPSGVFATAVDEEIAHKRETPYDYFGWNISVPTKRLFLEVSFPEGVELNQYGAEVRYAAGAPGLPSDRVQREEHKRFGAPSLVVTEMGTYHLISDINYPVIGLIYLLHWRPPRASTTRNPSS